MKKCVCVNECMNVRMYMCMYVCIGMERDHRGKCFFKELLKRNSFTVYDM